MILVIGLFGKSCVGKTVVSKLLARRLDLPVRHCGEAVKLRARELGVAFEELPKREHDRIDAETRRIARRTTTPTIIEGRFLDVVLKGLPNVLLVRLTASKEELLSRRLGRSVKTRQRPAPGSKGRDTGELFHKRGRGSRAQFTIKTDGISVVRVARQIVEHVKSLFDDAP